MKGVKLFKVGDTVTFNKQGFIEGKVVHVTRSGNLEVLPTKRAGGNPINAPRWKVWINVMKTPVKLKGESS